MYAVYAHTGHTVFMSIELLALTVLCAYVIAVSDMSVSIDYHMINTSLPMYSDAIIHVQTLLDSCCSKQQALRNITTRIYSTKCK
jgi:hypothetical protein